MSERRKSSAELREAGNLNINFEAQSVHYLVGLNLCFSWQVKHVLILRARRLLQWNSREKLFSLPLT